MSKTNGETVINVPAEKSTSTTNIGTKGKAVAAAGTVVATTKAIKHKGRWKRGIAILDFLLRLLAIATLLAAAISMGTADQILPFFTNHFQFRARFDDLPALLYFVIANAIAGGYLVLSLPFSIVTIIRPHIVGARILLLVIDTVMIALTSTAAAAAAAIVYLAHTGNSKANWVEICQQFNEFCQQTSGAVVASFVGALVFMILVVMSALVLRKH
ncbi:Uncharacterized protein family UPF0497 [Macleaya cordata]|uniref:CASP-like protein n=1 Tax=Macleaya cordata TaxID=56857 RepID=A0A200Q6F9_MACCD|nr:Uncharacterized protein family UPF0497 [Macleaya cordata]